MDDSNRKKAVYSLKNKSEAADKIEDFIVEAETQTGKKLKQLCTDNERAFICDLLKRFLRIGT